MNEELETRCKELIDRHEYDKCEKEIAKAMMELPHSAVPHNLMGILLGRQQDYVLAMKHFRAAYGLDPTYVPARFNMEQFGRPRGFITYAYTEEDCVDKRNSRFKMVQDMNNTSHIERE